MTTDLWSILAISCAGSSPESCVHKRAKYIRPLKSKASTLDCKVLLNALFFYRRRLSRYLAGVATLEWSLIVSSLLTIRKSFISEAKRYELSEQLGSFPSVT